MQLKGLHHLTAVTGEPSLNVAFYTQVLGLRLVKKTVNQDDTSAYHLFYGDALGSPGTEVTFFDWPHAGATYRGAGCITATALRVPGQAALEAWARRLADFGVPHEGIRELGGRAASGFRRSGRAAPGAGGRRVRTGGPALAGQSRGRGHGHPRAARRAPHRAARRTHGAAAHGAARLPGGRGIRGFRWSRAPFRGRARRTGNRGASEGAARAGPGAGGHRRGAPRGLPHPGRGPAGSLAPAPGRGGRGGDPGDRPLLLPLDLLPGARRGALRDRHGRARLRHRRGARTTWGRAWPCRRSWNPSVPASRPACGPSGRYR